MRVVLAAAGVMVAIAIGIAIAMSAGAPRPTAAIATPTSTPAPTAAQTSTAAATSSPAAAPGRITGKLGYPSDFIPELTVYAMRQGDLATFFSVDTPLYLYRQCPAGRCEYAIEGVAPGTYVVVAYPKSAAKGTTKGGGYTVYVRCGLAQGCPLDHTLIPVAVTSGGTVTGADATDWYLGPDDHYPPKPS